MKTAAVGAALTLSTVFVAALVILRQARTTTPNKLDAELFWGTYRPGPYVGLRSRSFDSPLVGLMWYKPSLGMAQVRHACSYYDGLTKYGWQEHDGASYGLQTIRDPRNGAVITVEWVKPEFGTDPDHWILRVTGEAGADGRSDACGSRSEFQQNDLSLLWYVSSPGDAQATFDPQSNSITGAHPSVGKSFWISVQDADDNKSAVYVDGRGNEYDYASTYSSSISVDERDQYDAKKYFFNELKNSVATTPAHLADAARPYREDGSFSGNLVTVQRFYDLPFSLDLHFGYRDRAWTSEEMNTTETAATIKDAKFANDRRFERTFMPGTSAVRFGSGAVVASTGGGGGSEWTAAQLAAAKYGLGNMLGSIVYMHGDRMIYRDGVVVREEPAGLFTGVPDRPDHGRGFLWDEGFHQHLVSAWDMDVTKEIVASWFATADPKTGWICREQMLGGESRAGAPPTSWAQSDSAANPPSLHLLIDNLLNRFDSDPELRAREFDGFKIFLAEIYDNFKRHVDWYQNTQSSDVAPNTFRWRGRTPAYCLPSGMDDYPRAPFQTEEEAHLDLQVWVIVSSRAFARVATTLGFRTDAARYDRKVRDFTTALHQHYWDEGRQLFDDFYVDADGAKRFVGHTGYLNFWPLFLDAVRTDDPRFGTTFRTMVADETGLVTPHGVRSLSVDDPYYRLGDNYWTGPIWININYLIISSLHRYKTDPTIGEALRGEIAASYEYLRKGVVDAISGEYERTGFIWEVYDDQTGEGRDNHPFTGWSALYTNLISEIY